jgi:hypothetical protein
MNPSNGNFQTGKSLRRKPARTAAAAALHGADIFNLV